MSDLFQRLLLLCSLCSRVLRSRPLVRTSSSLQPRHIGKSDVICIRPTLLGNIIDQSENSGSSFKFERIVICWPVKSISRERESHLSAVQRLEYFNRSYFEALTLLKAFYNFRNQSVKSKWL